MGTSKTITGEFGKYVVVGGLAFIADFLALALLVSGLGVHYLLATFLAFLLGVWVNYQLSVHWVFAYRALSRSSVEFAIFLAVGVMTLAASLGLMAIMVGGLDLHYLFAKCFAAVFTLIANFAGRRLLLFTNWARSEMGNE
jgi:putative flippase GtrA